MESKKCNKCQEIKPVSEFQKEARALNGYKPRCKMCNNEYNKLYYQNVYSNKKLLLAKSRYELIKDLPEEKEKRSNYYKKSRDIKREYNKKYLLLNKEKISKQSKEYRKLNIEKRKITRAEYVKNNKEKIRIMALKWSRLQYGKEDFKAKRNLSNLIHRVKTSQSRHCEEKLGYSISDFKKVSAG